MLKRLVLAYIVLGLLLPLVSKRPTDVLSPFVSRTEAQERVEKEFSVEDLFYKPEYKWDARKMIAICKVENGYQLRNGWDPNMVFTGNNDGSIDRGICSLNSIHGFDVELLADSEYNVSKAYEVWLTQGYEAWAVYNDDRYIAYLDH